MNKLKLVLESDPKYRKKSPVKSSQDSYNKLKPMFEDVMNYKERVVLLCIDRSNKIIGYNIISDGGVSFSIIDVKLVMQNALISNSSSIIIAHNHPSGTLKPSDADLKITEKIKKACEIMDLSLLDHLILTEESYYSFADEGTL